MTGFGTFTVGGSGRHLESPCTQILKVTSLADSGPGTLRACVQASGPRTCVFETSGHIMLLSDLDAGHPFLTIAGQTAPSPGILVSGASLRISAHDVLVQHISIRPGDANTLSSYGNRDGIGIRTAGEDTYNVVVDHVSLTWALDENAGIYSDSPSKECRDITFSNCIFAEGFYKSKHPDGIHSMGMLIAERSKNISVHHSLFAHNNKRNPMMKGGSSVELINNVVYDWRGDLASAVANVSDAELIGLPIRLNFIGNYYKRGPKSPSMAPVAGLPMFSGTRVYAYANIGPTRPVDSGSDWLIASIAEIPYRELSPTFPLSNIDVSAPVDAYEWVLANAGARIRDRTATKVDARIVDEVRRGTGDLKDCISGCSRSVGGWPAMPVTTRPFVQVSAPMSDDDGDGYTNLEEQLFEAAATVESRTP